MPDGQVVHQAMARMQPLCSTVVTTLEARIDDPTAPARRRVTAMQTVVERSGKARARADLQARLAALDAQSQETTA